MNGKAIVYLYLVFMLIASIQSIYSVYDEYNNCDAVCSQEQQFVFRKEPEQVAAQARLTKSLAAERERYRDRLPKNYKTIVHD